MTSLAGLDISGTDIITLSTATEAQPLKPKLFLTNSPQNFDEDAYGNTQSVDNLEQLLDGIGQHRELWRTHLIPDPAVSRHVDTVATELEAIVLRSRQLASKMPDSPMANARLASALFNANSFDEAVRAATKVSASELTDMSAALVAVRVLIQTGQKEAADVLLTRMSQKKEAESVTNTDTTVRCLSAALAAERRDFDLAFLRLEEAIGAQANALRGYLLLELAQRSRALHELRVARNLSRTQTPALLLNLAYAHAALGSPNKAIKTARQALEISPKNHLVLSHLAGYLLAAGRSIEAISILQNAAEPYDDLPADLAAALANAFVQAQNPKRALRVLQETAQRSHFRQSDPIQRAELQANAVMLAFSLRRLNRKQRLDSIRKQNDLANGRSIPIACMLADALASRTGRAEVMRAYEHLRTIYPERDLLPLRARLASMAGDMSEQLRLVQEWAQLMPLDIGALTTEVYLLCEFQDYEAAVSAGLTALRRFPHAVMLRNNTAYALALTGDLKRANRVLKPIAGLNSYAIATAGLIQLRKGHTETGIDLYRKAAEAARNEAVDAEYAAQSVAHLALHLYLVVRELNLADGPLGKGDVLDAPAFNSEWLNLPTFMTLASRAKRLSLSWPPKSQE